MEPLVEELPLVWRTCSPRCAFHLASLVWRPPQAVTARTPPRRAPTMNLAALYQSLRQQHPIHRPPRSCLSRPMLECLRKKFHWLWALVQVLQLSHLDLHRAHDLNLDFYHREKRQVRLGLVHLESMKLLARLKPKALPSPLIGSGPWFSS